MSALPSSLFTRGLDAAMPYAAPARCANTDLFLASNEGRGPADPGRLLEGLRDPDSFARYPSTAALRATLAERHDIAPDRILVTAGGDDLLLRACLATLEAGREALVATPTFEMIPRYVALAGGTLQGVPWDGERYPLEAVRARVTPRTRLVFLVSPNNPTGAVATAADLAALLDAAPRALILVDHAYVEFADEDLTGLALSSPRCVVLRTLSKAFGMAGLRVGYGLGDPRMLGALDAAGSPFPVAGPSLAMARARLAPDCAEEVRTYVGRVRAERERLCTRLAQLGARPLRSHANFVFARLRGAARLAGALAATGVAIRAFTDRPDLADAVRITCPGRPAEFARLVAALEDAFAKTQDPAR